MPRTVKSRFPDERDERTVLKKILEFSEVYDLPVSGAIEELNPIIKRTFGCTVSKGWFSSRVRRHDDLMSEWADIWKAKAAMDYEQLMADEIAYRDMMFESEEVEFYDAKGVKRKKKQRKLSMIDINAFKILEHSRRRRIATLMPRVFNTTMTAAGAGGANSVGFTIHLEPPEDED